MIFWILRLFINKNYLILIMKKVIVIGGGFAGSLAAKKLEKKFELTLIDTTDYFEFTPGILRTIVEPWHLGKIQVLHKDYLKKAKIIVGKVDEIARDFVRVGKKKMDFDYLVICSGSNYSLPIKEQEVLIVSRAKNVRKASEKLAGAKRVLIIGGGLVGVELSAEICMHWKDKEITLLHSGEKLIPRNNAKTIKYAEDFLRRRGVKLILGERMTDVKSGVCITDKGRRIKADVVFLTTGIKPNFEFMKKNFSSLLSDSHQIIVNEHLQLKGFERIFAAGDITSCSVEKTAQNAEEQAKIVVKNILALEKGVEMKSYKCKKTPLVISLGRYDGIYESRDFVFGGKIPALMKWMIEKWVMWRH